MDLSDRWVEVITSPSSEEQTVMIDRANRVAKIIDKNNMFDGLDLVQQHDLWWKLMAIHKVHDDVSCLH